MIKRLAGYLLFFCSVAWAQPEPVPLRVTRILGISTTTVVDNRNAVTRQNDMHTFCATGSGSWSIKIQYSNTSSSGPWSDFPNTFSTVSDASSACTGLAYGNYSWLRFLVTGTASAVYAGVKQFYIPTEFLSSGTVLASLNGLTGSSQTFATGTTGSDFGISSATSTHTFNLPTASGSARGALSSADWTTFNSKQSALTNSAGLRGALSDETGDGLAVFNTAPALDLPQFNVYSIGGTLPAAGTPNRLALVTNASAADDCTVGGGSTWVLCVDTGVAWVHPGGGGGSGGGSSTVTEVQAGTGVTVANGTTTPLVAIDDTIIPMFTSDTTDASGNCSLGTLWIRTDNGKTWWCTTTNTWTLVAELDANGRIVAAMMPALTGDVTTSAGAVATSVVKIQGRAMAATAPSDGQAIIWNQAGSTWEPGTVAGGSATGEYSGTINFGSVPDMSCLEDTFTATGATTAMIVTLSLPTAIETGLIANAWISAADTAKVRLCNLSGAAVDPASATFKVKTTSGYLSGSDTINFGSVPDASCLASTITVTGAASGDHVTPGWPTALETGLIGSMFVSASDTVAVRLCNFSGEAVDPASATFKAAVIK